MEHQILRQLGQWKNLLKLKIEQIQLEQNLVKHIVGCFTQNITQASCVFFCIQNSSVHKITNNSN
jgi:hypothetical protein